MLLENLGGLATGFSLTSLISVGGKSIYVPIATQVRFRRRTLKSPQFSTPEFAKIYRELRKEDRIFVEHHLTNDPIRSGKARAYSCNFDSSDLPNSAINEYSIESTKRIGLLSRKIGMTLQWLRNGERCLCTLLHIPENHVIHAWDPDTWYRRSITGKRKAFGKLQPCWSQMVGAINYDSPFYTNVYRRIFTNVGIPVKKKMANFLVSEDALVKPGTRLDAQHFTVGQFVTVSGKTIDWGFQGAMHRWGFKGQPKLHTTKSHRRLGSTGAKSDAGVWPGKRMHGHMGYEWRHAVGLEVLRINPIKQVIYVRGCVPGDIGEILLLKDCMIKEKRPINPPFPTYYPNDGTIREANVTNVHSQDPTSFVYDVSNLDKIYAITSQDLYHPDLFQFTQQSIEFTESDETKSAIRDKTHAKIAKARKS